MQAFENSFPFSRTNVIYFIDSLHELGDVKRVKREQLERMFTTPAWKGQLSPYGRVTILLDEMPETNEQGYDIEVLTVLALLWCHGSQEEKVSAFLKIVNPSHQE